MGCWLTSCPDGVLDSQAASSSRSINEIPRASLSCFSVTPPICFLVLMIFSAAELGTSEDGEFDEGWDLEDGEAEWQEPDSTAVNPAAPDIHATNKRRFDDLEEEDEAESASLSDSRPISPGTVVNESHSDYLADCRHTGSKRTRTV